MTESRKEFLIGFGQRVKAARLKRGMTLEEMANALGYTTENARSTAQKIEAGKSDLGTSQVVTLARVLTVSIEYLMGYDTERQRDERQLCDLMTKCYGADVYTTVTKFLQLDEKDRGYVEGVIDEKLKDDKYKQEAYASA